MNAFKLKGYLSIGGKSSSLELLLEAIVLTSFSSSIDLWHGVSDARPAPLCGDGLLDELRALAGQGRTAAEISAILYELLRKHMGQSLAIEILAGIQFLAMTNEPAGARLLAALLAVAAPAERLLPLVRNYSSSRRLWLARLRDDPSPGLIMEEWKQQFKKLAESCHDILSEKNLLAGIATGRIGWEEPWGAMRTLVAILVDHAMAGGDLGEDSRSLLVGMLRLEIDAWQERISSLAGTIDPFRVVAISRVLPILGKADADIRDLRHLVQLIEESKDEDAFRRPRLRALEVLEDRELSHLNKLLESHEELRPLGELYRAQQANPLSVVMLADGAARIQAFASLLRAEGLRRDNLDLLSACWLVVSRHAQGEVAIPVPGGLETKAENLLRAARGQRQESVGPGSWSLDGVEVLVGQLVVVLPEAGTLTSPWPEFLPSGQDSDPRNGPVLPATVERAPTVPDEQEEESSDHMTASAMKNLVLTNIQSTSLILGFLRNPKFVAIPGLVESVAVRTRNPRVIETIAVDRTLNSGFANRGVPLACLRSPVNVSVKILRKFIHVKYISKIDLKRLAQDRAGIRKEVIREIEKYLEALA